MPSGILTKGQLTTSLASVYTCPANTTAFITVNVSNRTAGTITADINLSTNTSENLGGYVEFSSPIDANQALEKTGIVLSAGQSVLVRSNNASSTFVIFGYERTI
jgi:hypothetical protein